MANTLVTLCTDIGSGIAHGLSSNLFAGAIRSDGFPITYALNTSDASVYCQLVV